MNFKHFFLVCISGFLLVTKAFSLNPNDFTISRITAPYFIVDGNSNSIITKAYVGFEIKNNNNSGIIYNGLKFDISSITSNVTGTTFGVIAPTNGRIAIGTLNPGESKICYFYISYPANVNPVATFNTFLSDNTTSGKASAFTIRNRSSISANAGGLSTQSITNQDVLGGLFIDDVTYSVGNARNGDELDFQVSVSSLFDPTKFQLISTEVISSNVPGVNAGTRDSLYFISGNGGTGQTATIRWKFRILSSNFTTYLLPCAGATSGNTNYKYALNSSIGANGTPVTFISSSDNLSIRKESDALNYAVCDTAIFKIWIKNNGLFGVTIDSILDQLPTNFTFIDLTADSDVQTNICTEYSTNGAINNIRFTGGVNTESNTSFYVPAGDSILLEYQAKVSCSVANGLSTSASAYIGNNAISGNNSVNVLDVLPIKLERFTAQWKEKKTILNWLISGDGDTNLFDIQRSADGQSWKNIGSVYRLNLTQTQFIFLDHSTLTGKNLYRLRMTGNTDKMQYSNIVQIDTRSKEKIIHVQNNLIVSNELKFDLSEPTFFQVINENGQVIYKKQFSLGVGHSINIPNLKPGIYFIKANDCTERIIKL